MTTPNTDHYYADRLHRRDSEPELDDDERADEHDALEEDDCGDY